MSWRAELEHFVRTVSAKDFARSLAPDDAVGRESAILLLFADTPQGPDLLIIERSRNLRSHSGQPAFPGGGAEPDDDTLITTALREAQEETGVNPADVTVIGLLPRLFVPVSGFIVTPVVAFWDRPGPVYAADPLEVADVLRIPIADFVNPANRVRWRHPRGYMGPGFEVGGLLVWGFTAQLIDDLLRLLGWDEPWDETRKVDVQVTT